MSEDEEPFESWIEMETIRDFDPLPFTIFGFTLLMALCAFALLFR